MSAQAQTGTGKTAAYLVTIFNRLLRSAAPEPRVPRALVIAPTRELVVQVASDAERLGAHTGLLVEAVFGGMDYREQREELRRGVDLLVGTPGRLIDYLEQGITVLKRVEVFVVDEADRMFDMGFLPDIRRILNLVPKKRQTLLFSATMPEEIRALANDALTNPVLVDVGATVAAVTVSHAIYPVAQHLKTSLVLNLLNHLDTDSVLIFTRTKSRTRRLSDQLKKAGFSAAMLQGDLSQSRRQDAMNGFRDGTYRILVATDIAARGIDVAQISHVINYDIPATTDAYIHRIGRTGRAAQTGDAFTLVTPADDDMVRSIERVLGSRIERRTIQGFDYLAPEPAHARTRTAAVKHAPEKEPRPQAHNRRKPAASPARRAGSGKQERHDRKR